MGRWEIRHHHPEGWSKPKENNGMLSIYQLALDFTTIHSGSKL
jgi:hypothetical protein